MVDKVSSTKQKTFDCSTEYMVEFATMIKIDYGIKPKPITTHNSQANAIIEHVYRTFGNIIYSFQVHDWELDKVDPWSSMLAAAMYTIHSTMQTTLRTMPMQLVFSRDDNLNIKFEAE
jgi:hypothetical protein